MRLARLDGIRGFAILIVFAHHVVNFKPGWVGVDLFFVLSGYLITRLLRRDREDTFFWGPFYIKRATRILPRLTIFFLLAFALIHFPWRQLGPYYFLFLANIADGLHHFKGDQEMTILWSLAVEEQFYLVWPFAVRFLGRRTLIVVLLAVLCAEPLLRGFFTPRLDWWGIYIMTPFRLDGLAAGSLLAILLEDDRWRLRLRSHAGSLALSLWAVFILCGFLPGFWYRANSVLFNMLGYSLVAAISTFGIAFVLFHEDALVSRVLANPQLAFLGLISYGAYLYHVLVVNAMQKFVILIGYNHMRTFSPLTAAVTFVLAWTSFRILEAPIIRWGQNQAKALNGRARNEATATV